MTQMMQDKVVVVTGSGGGIGREFALLMAAEGAKVVVNDIGASVSGEGEDAGPAMRAGFYGLDRSQDVFNWDPV
jgi:NAD(P)-dependent dehydrogenase (short-subunit alcohol dehydrogenase family)